VDTLLTPNGPFPQTGPLGAGVTSPVTAHLEHGYTMARILPFLRNAPSAVCRNAQRRPDSDSHTERTPKDDKFVLSVPEAWRPFVTIQRGGREERRESAESLVF
jgi:hypothetical protein